MHGHQPSLSLKSDFFQKTLGEEAGRAGQGGNSRSGWRVGKSGKVKVELNGRLGGVGRLINAASELVFRVLIWRLNQPTPEMPGDHLIPS